MDKNTYNDTYQKQNIVRITVKLNRKTEPELIAFVENQENKQGYIKDLIKADLIKKQNK